MSKIHIMLLALSLGLIILAEAIKRVTLSEKLTLAVGAVEILLAIGVGIAFGLTTHRDKEES
jgi:hypothetical protein